MLSSLPSFKAMIQKMAFYIQTKALRGFWIPSPRRSSHPRDWPEWSGCVRCQCAHCALTGSALPPCSLCTAWHRAACCRRLLLTPASSVTQYSQDSEQANLWRQTLPHTETFLLFWTENRENISVDLIIPRDKVKSGKSHFSKFQKVLDSCGWSAILMCVTWHWCCDPMLPPTLSQ